MQSTTDQIQYSARLVYRKILGICRNSYRKFYQEYMYIYFIIHTGRALMVHSSMVQLASCTLRMTSAARAVVAEP